MHVVAYTDSPGVGGAEISLAHLVAGTAADVTVLGSSASVVERVAAGRPAYVAPLRDHPRLLARLRPDVVHANLAVPWAGSVGLAAALRLQGVESELLLFPGEGHELSRSGRPRHRRACFEHVLRWWARHLPVS